MIRGQPGGLGGWGEKYWIWYLEGTAIFPHAEFA